MTSEYRDESHPTHFWTVQALYPPVLDGEWPTWHALFFLANEAEAKRSRDWAMDNPTYDHVLDLRVMRPDLPPPPKAGFPWAQVSSGRWRAIREAAAAKNADWTPPSRRPPRRSDRAANGPTAPATPTLGASVRRARAAQRFRQALAR